MKPAHSAIPRPARRAIARLAQVVCPPELRSHQLVPRLLDELGRYLAALPRRLRLGLLIGFVLFDQGARLHRPARGRRFADLDDARAEYYYRAVASGRSPAERGGARLLKGILVMSYYELPEVKAALGYQPEPYIATVARRRLASYADEIRRGEEAVFADEPGEPAARGGAR